jgi:hypothetical protein
MGGRLTEFDQVEMLTLTGGRARPVYGDKASAVPIAAIGKHLPDNRPVIRRIQTNVGGRSVDFTVEWAIGNDTPHPVMADYRIRLDRRRGGRDERWFEYHPEKGVTQDVVSSKTGGRAKITTYHGASKTTQAKPLTIRAAGTTTMRIGFSIPGIAASSAMAKFWGDRGYSTFNLLVAVYQLTANGPVELAEHDFQDVLALTASKVAPSRVPSSDAMPRPTPTRTPAPRRTTPAYDYAGGTIPGIRGV